MEEDEEGFDSEDGMNGLYDGLADRIWDENDWYDECLNCIDC